MPEEREDWKKIQSNQITPEAGIYTKMTIKDTYMENIVLEERKDFMKTQTAK